MEIAFRTERTVHIIIDGHISGVSVRQGSTVVGHLEHVVGRDEPKAIVGGLKVVEGLSHIPLGSEDDCFKTIICLWHLHVRR